MNNAKFDFHDILIEPEAMTQISTRASIRIHDNDGMLPLFTAPMTSVVDNKNKLIFLKNRIKVCMPRTLEAMDYSLDPDVFKSYSLSQFDKLFWIDGAKMQIHKNDKMYALIDIANGHMEDVWKSVLMSKKMWGDSLVLMVGNIANVDTYQILAEAGADYIRCGIGNGNGCLTTQQTGIGFPMASLIDEIYKRKSRVGLKAKIVADGGFRDYSDIIKALLLGADYVMLGSIFNQCLESAAVTTDMTGKVIDQYSVEAEGYVGTTWYLYKEFYGMSTKKAQKEIQGEDVKLKTSEGVERSQVVKYTLAQWVENFEHYLRSAMSYCNKLDINDKNPPKFNFITENAYNRFAK